MAKIKLSPWLSDIRGKIGSAVFQNSRGGLIVRNQGAKINKFTNRESVSRSVTSSLQAQWVNLTPAQREIWTKIVLYQNLNQKRGNKIQITGQNAFIKFNYYRIRYNISILTEPEFEKCAINPIIVSVGLLGDQLIITANRDLDSTNEFIILSLTNIYNPTINNPGSAFKLIIFETTDTDTFNITPQYEETFGRVPVTSDIIFIKYTNSDKNSGLPFPFKQERVIL